MAYDIQKLFRQRKQAQSHGKFADYFEVEMIEFEGEGDHVRLLINYPPKVQISKLVNSLKTASSRVIRKREYPSIQKALWGGALWSPSYFAGSCGGVPLEVVKEYIQSQDAAVRALASAEAAARAGAFYLRPYEGLMKDEVLRHQG